MRDARFSTNSVRPRRSSAGAPTAVAPRGGGSSSARPQGETSGDGPTRRRRHTPILPQPSATAEPLCRRARLTSYGRARPSDSHVEAAVPEEELPRTIHDAPTRQVRHRHRSAPGRSRRSHGGRVDGRGRRRTAVAGLFGIGLAIGGARLGVALAIGAHLVAIVSRKESIRSPFVVLLVVTVAMGLAAFTGSITAGVPALHIAVLAMWCLAGGLLVALGPARQTIGVQALIVFIIFGRLPESRRGAGPGRADRPRRGDRDPLARHCAVCRLPCASSARRSRTPWTLWRRLPSPTRTPSPSQPVRPSTAPPGSSPPLPVQPGRRRRLQALADEGRRMRIEMSGCPACAAPLEPRPVRRGRTRRPVGGPSGAQSLSGALRVAAGLVAAYSGRDLSPLGRAIAGLERAVAAIEVDLRSRPTRPGFSRSGHATPAGPRRPAAVAERLSLASAPRCPRIGTGA